MSKLAFALAFFGFGILFGLDTAVSAQTAPIVMKIGAGTSNDAQYEFLKRFAASVDKDTKGRIAVELYPGGQLGSIPREIEMTQFGAIQGVATIPEFFLGVDPRFQILGTPGLFANMDQFNSVLLDPEFSRSFLALGADKGLKGLALWVYGSNAIVTRKEVASIADLRNLKIRVLAGAAQESEMRLLGAVGVPMPIDQVLPGLQQGAIDGTLIGISSAAPYHYYSVAPYALDVVQPFLADVIFINQSWFDKLTPDLQKILTNDAAKLDRDFYSATKAADVAQQKAWIAGGGKIARLSAADRAAILSKLANVGEDVYKNEPKVLAMFRELKAIAARHKP